MSGRGASIGGGTEIWRRPNCLITRCWAISSTLTSKIIFDFVIQYASSRVHMIEIPPGNFDAIASGEYGSQITEAPERTSNCSLNAG
jgi:hypothetical protein